MKEEVAAGIIDALFKIVVFYLLAGLIINVIRDRYWINADDSDDHANRRRSGVAIVTDHKTKLQYLTTPKGGITPRMGVDGRQLTAQD